MTAMEKAPYNEPVVTSKPTGTMTRARMFGMNQPDPVSSGGSGGQLSQSMKKWFDKLRLRVNGESGTTAQRPTSDLFIGRTYFDTTLGKPIWVSNASTPTWVDATGASV